MEKNWTEEETRAELLKLPGNTLTHFVAINDKRFAIYDEGVHGSHHLKRYRVANVIENGNLQTSLHGFASVKEAFDQVYLLALARRV